MGRNGFTAWIGRTGTRYQYDEAASHMNHEVALAFLSCTLSVPTSSVHADIFSPRIYLLSWEGMAGFVRPTVCAYPGGAGHADPFGRSRRPRRAIEISLASLAFCTLFPPGGWLDCLAHRTISIMAPAPSM